LVLLKVLVVMLKRQNIKTLPFIIIIIIMFNTCLFFF
jgi:hypothetical protein